MKNLLLKKLGQLLFGDYSTEEFYVSTITMTYWPQWAFDFFYDTREDINVGDTLIRSKITGQITIKRQNK